MSKALSVLCFKTWIRTVEANRSRRADSQGLYLCPVWYRNHFTLLEINDRLKKILFYDTAGKKNSTNDVVLKRIQKDFKAMTDKEFVIEKSPCPQQADDTGCGPLVVRMAIQRMDGQEVGGWDDPVIPARVRMEIVELFDKCKDAAEIQLLDVMKEIVPLSKENTPEMVEVSQEVTSPRKRKAEDECDGRQTTRQRSE